MVWLDQPPNKFNFEQGREQNEASKKRSSIVVKRTNDSDDEDREDHQGG